MSQISLNTTSIITNSHIGYYMTVYMNIKGARSPVRLIGPKSVTHLYSYAYNYQRHDLRYDHWIHSIIWFRLFLWKSHLCVTNIFVRNDDYIVGLTSHYSFKICLINASPYVIARSQVWVNEGALYSYKATFIQIIKGAKRSLQHQWYYGSHFLDIRHLTLQHIVEGLKPKWYPEWTG